MMRGSNDDGGGRSQLLKGVLEMCLLALIAEEPRYGYEMTQKLHERGLDLVSEGSIYPLLSRLAKQGLVETYLEGSSGGPQRKYYRLRKEGRQRLARWRREWETLTAGVEAVLNEGTR
jgi:PadR family transcriptional regulator PadR